MDRLTAAVKQIPSCQSLVKGRQTYYYKLNWSTPSTKYTSIFVIPKSNKMEFSKTKNRRNGENHAQETLEGAEVGFVRDQGLAHTHTYPTKNNDSTLKSQTYRFEH